MAKKLILVDEDKYNALINQQKDEGNLNVLRDDAEKALSKRTKNLSTKNINYQQTFRRYLKARK
jgi:phage tail sheath gpL-like